jgi:hypothetical protein
MIKNNCFFLFPKHFQYKFEAKENNLLNNLKSYELNY